MLNWLNRMIVLGRRSELWYVRVYPNPGFMVPLSRSRRFVWSWHKGGVVRAAGSRRQPTAWINSQKG